MRVLERTDHEFEIADPVNCTFIDLQDFTQRGYLQQFFSMTTEEREALFTAALGSSEDSLREEAEALQEVLAEHSSINQFQAALGTLTASGLSWMTLIESPSVGGESLVFSYKMSYHRPLSRPLAASALFIEDASSALLGFTVYASSPGNKAFFVFPKTTVPRVTLRIMAQRSLKVVPLLRSPETEHMWSMPFIPLGVLNLKPREPDGSYEHTFRNLPSDSLASLVWLSE